MRTGLVGATGVAGRPPVLTVDGRREVSLMTNAPVSRTRREMLRAITSIVAVATSSVLAGCGTSTSTTPTPGGVAPGTLVVVIRRGENRLACQHDAVRPAP